MSTEPELTEKQLMLFLAAQFLLASKEDKIKLEKPIGAGGFGLVAKGTIELKIDEDPNQEGHTDNGKPKKPPKHDCAVKIAYPHLINGDNPDDNEINRNRFNAEFAKGEEVFNRLRDIPGDLEKHIVRCFARGDYDGTYLGEFYNLRYIVFEYVSGKDLSNRVLSCADVLEVGKKVCAVLGAAHPTSVHRDIKPSNLFIPDQDITQLKIGDWGLARSTHVFKPRRRRYPATLGFASPEQIDRRLGMEVDHRTDLYSLGATLYALLTGQPPYTQTDAKNLIRKGTPLPEPSPPNSSLEVPSGMRDIIQRLMAKNRAERYQSAYDVQKDLMGVYVKRQSF